MIVNPVEEGEGGRAADPFAGMKEPGESFLVIVSVNVLCCACRILLCSRLEHRRGAMLSSNLDFSYPPSTKRS